MDETALAFVKRRSDMFRFRSKQPGLGLVEWLTRDALVYGNRAAEVFQLEGWWFVVSEADWLLYGDDDALVEEAFYKIIATPTIEDNGLRAEILLTAFAEAVWIATPGKFKMIKGDEGQINQIERLIEHRQLPGNWRRMVAFLPQVDEMTL